MYTSVIYMYSVLILQKDMRLVSVVQLVSVNLCPSAPQRSASGWGGKHSQTLFVLGRLCIVLMETSFYYKPS